MSWSACGPTPPGTPPRPTDSPPATSGRGMLEQGSPRAAVVAERVLSGEVERTYRLVRREGCAAQMAHHSPTSQYRQMSRAARYGHLDMVTAMRELVDDTASGRFA